MNVPDDHKATVLAALCAQLMPALAEAATDRDVSADDMIDFFVMGVAAVIDNDGHLRTPRDRRLAVEVVAARIAARIKDIGEYREKYGQSFLAAALAAPMDRSILN